MSETSETPTHDPNIKHMADDINVPVLVVSALVTTFLVLVFIFGVQAFYYHYENLDRQEKVVKAQYRDSVSKVQEQELRLNPPQPVWVDKEKGKVAIKISQAMEIVVDELSERAEGSR